MTEFNDQDNEMIVLDFGDDPVVTHPIAPQLFFGLERAPHLSRMLEVYESLLKERSYQSCGLAVQAAYLLLCPCRYPNLVFHSGHSTSSNGIDSSPDRR